MRSLIVCLILVGACGPTTPPITEKTTVPTNMSEDKTTGVTGDKKKQNAAVDGWRSGPGGFPIPHDADSGTQVVGNDMQFQIPRKHETVHTELRKHLSSVGYSVDSDQKHMGGYRMVVKNRDGKQFAVTVTENGDKASLMTVTAK